MTPLSIGLNAVPIFVLVALFNNMYPVTSEVPRRLMVTLVVYFIVLVNVARGLREVGAIQLELMRSYAASDVAILRKVRVPNAVPYLFTALRIAAPASVITAFVSEYFGGSQNGLGSRIVGNIALSNNAEAWAYVLAACLLGLTFYLVAVVLERVATPGRGGRSGAGWGMMSHPLGSVGGDPPRGKGAHMRGTRFRLVRDRCAGAGARRRGVQRRRRRRDDAAVAARRRPASARQADSVTLQLQWFIQSQFAGYFAAQDQGFYADQCLDVTIAEGSVDIVPQQQLADGVADFAIAWVPKALASARGRREHRRHRPGVPAFGDAAGLVRGRRHHVAGRLRRQDRRQLGVRQRVRDLRRADRGGAGPGVGRRRSCSRTSTCPGCSRATSTRPRP